MANEERLSASPRLQAQFEVFLANHEIHEIHENVFRGLTPQSSSDALDFHTLREALLNLLSCI